MKNFKNINYCNNIKDYEEMFRCCEEISRVTEKYHLGAIVFYSIILAGIILILNMITSVII